MSSDANNLSALTSWVLFAGKIVGGIFTLAIYMLYRNQDSILYIPNPPGFPKTPDKNPNFMKNPGEWTVTGYPRTGKYKDVDPIPYEEISLTTVDNVKIHCWLLLQKQQDPSTPTLVYFHGNAGNMGFRLRNAAEMYARCKLNILMMDYRGYGASEGNPTEIGLNFDADSVLKYLINNPKILGPIILFGRSLGGAVSISLAERFPNNIHGIIVENTFLSISKMVDVLMPFLKYLKKYVLKINWNSDYKIKQLTQPILFYSGDSDELVPPFHMKRLYDFAVKSYNRVFFSVSGGTHNDTWDKAGSKYYEVMNEFIKSVIEFKSGNAACNSSSEISSENNSIVDSETIASSIPTMTKRLIVK